MSAIPIILNSATTAANSANMINHPNNNGDFSIVGIFLLIILGISFIGLLIVAFTAIRERYL